VAEEYERVRSGYPATLVDRAVAAGGLEPGDFVVEIGPGTGKLTRELAERGLVVDAVEPDGDLAAVARAIVGDAPVRFHIATFEDVELPEGAFKAVFAATSYHWIDPDVGWAKAASLLEPDGLLALLVYTALRDQDTAELYDELHTVLERIAPEVAARLRPPRTLETIQDGVSERRENASEVWDWLMGDGRHELAQASAAELFADVDVARETRVVEETVDEWIDKSKTTSLYLQLDADQLAALEDGDRQVIERRGGSLRTPLATFLMTARRAG